MKKTAWKVSDGGRVVTRRQLEHSLNQLAQTFIRGLQQMEEHFDARLKQLEPPPAPPRTLEMVPASCAPTDAEVAAFKAKVDAPKVSA